MSVPMTVICPFCGISQVMEVPEEATEKELEDIAASVCGCDQAKHLQKKNSVKDKIDMLFGDGSEAHGFDSPLEEPEIESLMGICADVLDGKYINASVTLPSGDKARITTVKDRIKIVRESKNSAETKI